jgi:hypothetical protein
MKTPTPAIEGVPPILRIHEPPEADILFLDPLEMEDQRKRIEDQAQAEDFWAGRNLGDRKSARVAA